MTYTPPRSGGARLAGAAAPWPDAAHLAAYRAWDRGTITFRKRYRGKVLYERAVVALCEHLWAVPDTHALVRSWFDAEKRWVGRALAAADLRIPAEAVTVSLAEAYHRRACDIQRQMGGLP